METNRYIDGTYLEKVTDWHAGDSPWKASKILQMLEKNNLKPKSIYDVGCGAGEILVELQKRMDEETELCGYDISPQAISISKKKQNDKLRFYNEDFLTSNASPPDLLLLLDVFEHVPDYMGFLDVLRIKVDWILFHIPLDIAARELLRRSEYMLYMREKFGHLHYFTKDTALATLRDVGYEIIDYYYTDDAETAVKAPRRLKQKLNYKLRKFVFYWKPDLAASLWSNFNIMVLARGDIRSERRTSKV